MANTKISDLTQQSKPLSTDDLIHLVDVSDTTMDTSGTNKYLEAITLLGGWIDLSADDSFEYVDSTTIKISGEDRTDLFMKGTKIRLQNNNSGTWLYFWVTDDATFSTDTTIDVTGEDDVPSATLTDGGFSYANNPYGMKDPQSQFCARGALSSNQSLAGDNSIAVVQFDTTTYDPNGNWDTTTDYDWTAPISARYLVNANVALGGGADGDKIDIFVDKNASTTLQGRSHMSSTEDVTVTTSDVLSLDKGDTIRIRARQNTGGAINMGTTGTSLAINYIGL